jgi:queuosine precursor transporter
MRALKIGALTVPYLTAVVAANLLVNHYGPKAAPAIAFVAVAAVLILRDQFAQLTGQRWHAQLLQTALIAAGALATYLINQDAALIAKASVIAFAASETTEQIAYYVMRRRPWMEKAPYSAVLGAAVDSTLFITIAFGFDVWIVIGQFAAKIGGAWLWATVLDKTKARHAVPARDTPAELA